MMKLLYIPTGNVFTLPDEVALKHYKSDTFNYKILDAGFVDEEAPVQLPPQTVEALVMAQNDEDAVEETDDIAEAVIVEEKKEEVDLMKLPKDELFGMCRRLGIKGVTKSKTTKERMVELINSVTVEDVAGE